MVVSGAMSLSSANSVQGAAVADLLSLNPLDAWNVGALSAGTSGNSEMKTMVCEMKTMAEGEGKTPYQEEGLSRGRGKWAFERRGE